MISDTLSTPVNTSANNTSSSSSNNSSSSSSSNGQLAFTQNFNTFLTLLTTQLQHQDPLSPLDTNQFTQQLVSFSQVEQQIDTNNNLSQLIQLQTAGETVSAIPLVGQTIQYNSATAPLSGGQADFSYTLPSTAARAALMVTDSNGSVVYAANGDPTAGTHSFNWNGQTSNGLQLPDGGTYTLQVVATDANNNAVQSTITASGTVTGVSVTNNQPTFNVSGVSVPMSELVSVVPQSTNSSTSSN